MTRSFKRTAALVATAALGATIGAAVFDAVDHGRGSSTTTTVAAAPTAAATQSSARNVSSTLTVAQVAKGATPSVVEVDATTGSSGPFGGGGGSSASGTGFVYDGENHVVTNEHVVDGATSVRVKLADGAVYRATVVGSDASTDLAVLKVNAPAGALHPLRLGDSSAVTVGETVVAIGDPYQLDGTVTTGIVSALGREITAPDNSPIENAIQTDAAINHGNSGGPLLDLSGNVIGVTSQIQSDSGVNDGIGFAVPSNTVARIVPQLISKGSIKHALLGIEARTIPVSLAGMLGEAGGVAVATVESGSGAAAAGLHASTGSTTIAGVDYPTGGDVITAVDGTAVTTSERLRAIIDTHSPGERLQLRVTRNGSTRTVTATLGTRS
jgi:putative serine protease PepD